ncbi:predicted protein, partial [Nematostella vectensis]
NGTLSIVLRRTTDAGRYVCTAVNAIGIIHKSTNYIVWYENRPFKTKIGNNLTTMKGRKLTLICHATGRPRPTITWFRGGEEMRTKVTNNGSLILEKVSSSDIGRYTCTARNAFGKDNANSTTIPPGDGSPVKVSVGDNITVITDTPLLIDCEVSGIPFPSVVWVKDGRVLMGEGYVIFDNGTLVLRRARPADSGRYTCTANNSRGKDHISSQPTIERPVAPRDIPLGDGSPTIARIADNATVLTGSRLTIDCVATGVPKPSIIWRKDGRELIGAGSYMAPGNGSLLIQQVAASHHGVFTCTATNPVGEDSVSSNIRVRTTDKVEKSDMKPVDVRIGGQVTSLSGVDITLNCSARGLPPPDIEWMNGGKMITVQGPRLVLRNVMSSDSGNYTCIASNVVGRASASTMVNVTGR